MGGLGSGYFWSSSEYANSNAWRVYMSNGSVDNARNIRDNYIRPVRAF